MSDLSTYLGAKLLTFFKATNLPSAPANVYAAIYNGDPESGGTEVTGTVGLTRQAVTWGTEAARAIANTAEVNFGNASGSATVTYVALLDASAAGNILCKKAISSAAISSGEKVSMAVGACSLTY